MVFDEKIPRLGGMSDLAQLAGRCLFCMDVGRWTVAFSLVMGAISLAMCRWKREVYLPSTNIREMPHVFLLLSFS